MDPSKQIKYSDLPSGSSNSKWPSEMSVDKYPGNELLLTHIDKKYQDSNDTTPSPTPLK